MVGSDNGEGKSNEEMEEEVQGKTAVTARWGERVAVGVRSFERKILLGVELSAITCETDA